MPALKELHLDTTELYSFWFGIIATSLTALTQLTLASCRLANYVSVFDGDVEIVAVNSVRCISWRQLIIADCLSVYFHNHSSCIEELVELPVDKVTA